MAKNKKTLDELLQEAIVKDAPYEVPGNWVWSNINTISSEIKNGTTIKQNKEVNGIKVTRIESIQNNTIDFKRIGYVVDNSKIKDKDYYKNGDIALSHINSIEHVGKTALITEKMLPLIHGMNLLRIRFYKQLINPQLFQLYTQSYDFKKEVVNKVNRAVNQVSLNQKMLSQIKFPIPPLKEQERIVQKIEGLFEKLDKAKKLIEEVREDFEKRKASILEKAFRGELTEKWREENKYLYEKQYFNIGEVCDINPKKDILNEIDNNTKCTFVPMASVNHINGKADVHLTKLYSDVKKGYTFFKEDDILFAKITPCMENGKTAIVKGLINKFGFGSTEFHVIRCKNNVLNKYIYYLLRSKMFRNLAKQNMTGAVGQQRVPKDFIQHYNIWLPPLEEQKEIVRILDKLLDEENKIEKLTNLENQIELTKKSILAKAFRGELGTNDPSEESAMELLKEVLQEKL
ncbi:Type-1 restriction enzyme EcoKI specificity protein [Clostridium haemolyticum]|uniref:restriction endonuclease subunit S n=1 Tax=Clostridium haemolyticum TaxID=84025 RepID=UPI001C3C1851|nr:restriction endonuclease subunit S [Clostridium haemolyticum]CAG7840414.1 Type-1 restriction enzyme EcoKI specificity protein [Clostridium haemolyticum]